MESLGLKALSIPESSEHGVDLGLLAKGIEQNPVKAVVLVPTFNNPSGSCMIEECRHQLLEILADYDLPPIEDDLYGDLQFSGERLRPIKGFDEEGRGILCGT